MNAYQTTPPRKPGGDYLFEAGFDADFDAPAPAPVDADAIKKRAHIANGGEGTETFTCPACRGRGRFIAYTGRDVGPCHKCKGGGKISKGQQAAIKGKATKEANRIKWAEDHADEIAYITKRANKGSNFYASFIDKLREYGSLTENQMAIVAKDRAKDAEFWAAKKAAAPVIQMSAIEALFARAPVKLVKKPVFRTTEVTIKQAPAHGVNAGALYVYDTGEKEYLGKIVGGKWQAKWGTKDVTEALKAVAADPTAEAIKYATEFKACCCCGKSLFNPVSALAVVGPVCAPRWGLDHLRLAAAEMLAEEAATEAAKEGKA
jgi:hypothetical protein